MAFVSKIQMIRLLRKIRFTEKDMRVDFVMELPEVVIQHIQSFLDAKEIAQISIISKSWYEAGLTRPYLDFSEFDFEKQADFVKVMNKTLERYEKLKLKIKRFKLLLTNTFDEVKYKEWIKRAMQLGASEVDIEIFPSSLQKFVLPREVLGSEFLTRLSFVGGTIDARYLKESCSTLKSLNLFEVYIQGSNSIWNIISMCPLIEELVLSSCMGSYSSTSFTKELVLKSNLGVSDFHKLKVLSLDFVKIGECLFGDLSKSPCLKELTLVCCTGFKEIQICSNSLEFIHLDDRERRMLRAKFDVPRIRKFIFTSSRVPILCFKTTSREWESRISFNSIVVDFSWFVEFRKFLLELNSSKIHVHLKIYISREVANECNNNMIGDGFPKPPTVEKLNLNLMNAPFSVQLKVIENLFWSCRPKFINGTVSSDFVKLICITLVKLKKSVHDMILRRQM